MQKGWCIIEAFTVYALETVELTCSCQLPFDETKTHKNSSRTQ